MIEMTNKAGKMYSTVNNVLTNTLQGLKVTNERQSIGQCEATTVPYSTHHRDEEWT